MSPEPWYCWRASLDVYVFDTAAWGDGHPLEITREEVQAYEALKDQLRAATARIERRPRLPHSHRPPHE